LKYTSSIFYIVADFTGIIHENKRQKFSFIVLIVKTIQFFNRILFIESAPDLLSDLNNQAELA